MDTMMGIISPCIMHTKTRVQNMVNVTILVVCWAFNKWYIFLLFFFKILFIFREEKGERETLCGCLSHSPYWGPGPQSRACALAGNWTSNPLVNGLALSPLSHTNQVTNGIYFLISLIFRLNITSSCVFLPNFSL